MCVSPNIKSLLIMLAVFAALALLVMLTGCSEARPSSAGLVERSQDDLYNTLTRENAALDRLIAHSLQRMRAIDDGLARARELNIRARRLGGANVIR